MSFACIFVPDFPVAALVRAQPELGARAVAALEGKAPLQKVFATNEAARRAGVNAGMTKSQLEACTGLVLQPRSKTQEAAAHAALLDCAQSFSPRVEDVADDLIILDLGGMQTILGSVQRIARKLAMRASHLGLKSNVAIASNPDSAMLAARGFPGVMVIDEGKEAEQLAALPVELLFEANLACRDNHPADEEQDAVATLTTLHRWGIWNLRALAALPEIALVERLGQRGFELQQLSLGRTFRTLVPVDPPMIFEETMELEDPIVLLEPMAFLLDRMLGKICERLESRAFATQELHLKLELDLGYKDDEDEAKPVFDASSSLHKTFERTLRLPLPLLDRNIFLKLLQLDLKAHPPGAPIRKIQLSAAPVQPRRSQSGLFQPPSPEPEKLELTLARIAGIVGEGNVGSLVVLDTQRPEAFRRHHFCPETETKNSRRRSQAGPPYVIQKRSRELVTAMRIFRPPEPVSVTLQDGKPVRIDSPRPLPMHGEVIWKAGPWRFSGDWWEQQAWARDEWDIAVQGSHQGEIALYRMVHDLLNGVWFLEGTYD